MINDVKLTSEVKDILITLQEASVKLYEYITTNQYENINSFMSDINTLLKKTIKLGEDIEKSDSTITLSKNLLCALDSLERVDKYISLNDYSTACNKIEFEFLPILKEAYLLFHYWGCVYPDKAKIKEYYDHEIQLLAQNEYLLDAEESGNYKYELTILITAYNKLEYTKICVQSLLANIPKDVSYELILHNHGSSDGTKEYFESIKPTKQFDTKINGGIGKANQRIFEGKYILAISNDVVITKHAIENMLRCIRSDDSVGYIVPSTTNVSNLQSIDMNYTTLDEVLAFADRNNHYDIYRHEERVRLCNPLSMYRSSALYSKNIKPWHGHFISGEILAFPDDMVSLSIRRLGYKLILQKDAFCYHFGSITIKEDPSISSAEFYENGRKAFFDTYGIDPWHKSNCYDPNLFQNFHCSFEGHVDILGINCGVGSNPLKVKEKYKEVCHNTDITVVNTTDNPSFGEDLACISNSFYLHKDLSDLFKTNEKYHHIIIDEVSKNIRVQNLINECLNHLHVGGSVYIDTKNISICIPSIYPEVFVFGYWVAIKKE